MSDIFPSNTLNNTIKAIIGLGNPGADYAQTRHNVGAWFAEKISQKYQTQLRKESKLFAHYSKVVIDGNAVHLLVPDTYMNNSGQAVAMLCKFYKLKPEDMLIAHDELDFDAGISRLKFSGGHGGHNGLRDIISALDSKDFFRLRIGIGHPGNKNQVSDYVLKHPSKHEHIEIISSIDATLRTLDDIVQGRWEQAMRKLHAP